MQVLLVCLVLLLGNGLMSLGLPRFTAALCLAQAAAAVTVLGLGLCLALLVLDLGFVPSAAAADYILLRLRLC